MSTVARDHRLFYQNGNALNGHYRVIRVAVPVLKALLRIGGVAKVNTAPSRQAHGQRSIKIAPTDTGLSVDVRGDGRRQVVYVCTSDPETVTQIIGKKFLEFLKD